MSEQDLLAPYYNIYTKPVKNHRDGKLISRIEARGEPDIYLHRKRSALDKLGANFNASGFFGKKGYTIWKAAWLQSMTPEAKWPEADIECPGFRRIPDPFEIKAMLCLQEQAERALKEIYLHANKIPLINQIPPSTYQFTFRSIVVNPNARNRWVIAVLLARTKRSGQDMILGTSQGSGHIAAMKKLLNHRLCDQEDYDQRWVEWRLLTLQARENL